jgi:cytochrome c2
MSRSVVVALLVAVGVTPGVSQTSMVDRIEAARGQHVWDEKQCAGCHSFGRQQSTGPDLRGVTERRSPEWLRAWLKNPAAQDDPTARMLRKQYDAQMPNLGLTDDEVADLIAFLTQRDQAQHKT